MRSSTTRAKHDAKVRMLLRVHSFHRRFTKKINDHPVIADFWDDERRAMRRRKGHDDIFSKVVVILAVCAPLGDGQYRFGNSSRGMCCLPRYTVLELWSLFRGPRRAVGRLSAATLLGRRLDSTADPGPDFIVSNTARVGCLFRAFNDTHGTQGFFACSAIDASP